MIVMGIDPSLTSTGWVVLKDGIVKESGTIESKEKGVKRLLEIEEAIEDAIYHLQPKIVYIEGYAFSQANKAHAMGELGGVLRRRLWKLKLKESIKTWNEIQPSAVKKFATGKGNAKKEDMKLAVFKKWGVEFATNDETDAFVLAKMAEVEANGDTMPQASTKAKGSTKRLRAKNKNSTPKKVLKEVEERDNGLCRVCLRLYRDPHHIIKRSQASKEWVHDPRNIECLCGECHGKTENDHKFRLSRERQAVIDFGWLNGRAMTLSEWEIWRNWK